MLVVATVEVVLIIPLVALLVVELVIASVLDIAQVNVETHVQETVTLDAQVIVYLLVADDVMEAAQEVVLVTVADAVVAEELVAQAVKDALEIAIILAKINVALVAVQALVAEDVAQPVQRTVNQAVPADVVQHVVLIAQELQHNGKEEHINGRIKNNC